jgi:hypothetical protein
MNKPSTEHHIDKKFIFGQNDNVGYLCRDCHDDIEVAIRVFEAEVLQNFHYCYKHIWRQYVRTGSVSRNAVRKLARTQFVLVKQEIAGIDPRYEKTIQDKLNILDNGVNISTIKRLNGIKAEANNGYR